MFGDVVTYEENDNFITHRIIEEDVDGFVTKGDKNNEVDTEIFKSQVVGKVIFHSLFWGIIVTKYLKYILIGFSIFVIIINIYWSNKEKRYEENEGKEKREESENKTIE